MLSTIEKITNLVETAGRSATRKSGGWNEREMKDSPDIYAQFFLENWDDEREKFYYALLKSGFKTNCYKANYYWEVVKDGIAVSYVEGDVYIKQYSN